MELNSRERGFLLLSSHLGDPERKPLTVAQLRELGRRMGKPGTDASDRDVEPGDLMALGFGSELSRHICGLLSEEERLDAYLKKGEKAGCVPVTRATECYPLILRHRLGMDSPGVIWAKGDLSLLSAPAIALVGSRDLRPENRAFAEAVGQQAAWQGLALVSGNARGADRAAQEACSQNGGAVISVVADALSGHDPGERMLFLSEDGYEEPFSVQRALSRNRMIHALGRITFVAQASLERGGTWSGSIKNLRQGWSPLVCFRDGSEAAFRLEQLGAYLIEREELKDFGALASEQLNFFDR